jgi:long-chain acyl-CoA synthetase
MSRNLGLTSLGDGEASDDTVLIDLLDPDHPLQFSKAALNELTSSVAKFVQASDIHRGERVGILGLNSVYFVAALLGIMRAGAVAVPINFVRSPQAEINEDEVK